MITDMPHELSENLVLNMPVYVTTCSGHGTRLINTAPASKQSYKPTSQQVGKPVTPATPETPATQATQTSLQIESMKSILTLFDLISILTLSGPGGGGAERPR